MSGVNDVDKCAEEYRSYILSTVKEVIENTSSVVTPEMIHSMVNNRLKAELLATIDRGVSEALRSVTKKTATLVQDTLEPLVKSVVDVNTIKSVLEKESVKHSIAETIINHYVKEPYDAY